MEAEKKSVLHVCRREMLRPLRDQILRLTGFEVDSCLSFEDGLAHFWQKHYDLVLIDVESEESVIEAEKFCTDIKTAQAQQLVAFVCNWRVHMHSACPDEVLRTQFDPKAFVQGVQEMLE